MTAPRPRPVDTSGIDRLVRELETGVTDGEQIRKLARELPPEMANLRRQLGVPPVAVNGSRARGLKAGYFKTPLRDGSFGYFQRRTDDCLQAAIASCLQIPSHLVPDLRLEQQIAAGRDPDEIERAASAMLDPWLEKHGVQMMIHPVLPSSARRWIGVVESGEAYSDHCLLMTGRDCLFDPFRLLPPRKGQDPSAYDVGDIGYGITLERN